MWPIANMVWAIGDIADPIQQVRWIRQGGFDGVAFHACAGQLPWWAGIDPAACDAAARRQWRSDLADFRLREVHAPFEIEFVQGKLPQAAAALTPIIAFAGDLGVDVVTAHAALPAEADPASQEWLDTMGQINAAAAAAGVRIGLEILGDFAWLDRWRLPNIGVTLDVGHLFSAVGGAGGIEKIGGISGLIRRIAPHLVHLHVHDHNGQVDHIETGTGLIDFADMFCGLAAINYRYGMTLEFNPSRVTPEGMLRSREYLHQVARASRP
ncbi:MAG: sugar phosphate isomerase/epimerase [Planctomycetaceae bacterium]|nr:sugar phosphate isomerase/epimerase [Planctomycetaceae bacterium]